MEKIIFRAPSGKRFRAPQPSARQIWAMILFKFTKIRTAPYYEALKTYRTAWKKHAERIQAELDAEHAKPFYTTARTGGISYRQTDGMPD